MKFGHAFTTNHDHLKDLMFPLLREEHRILEGTSALLCTKKNTDHGYLLTTVGVWICSFCHRLVYLQLAEGTKWLNPSSTATVCFDAPCTLHIIFSSLHSCNTFMFSFFQELKNQPSLQRWTWHYQLIIVFSMRTLEVILRYAQLCYLGTLLKSVGCMFAGKFLSALALNFSNIQRLLL